MEAFEYVKYNLVWEICGEYYALHEAVAKGYWFEKIKKPKYLDMIKSTESSSKKINNEEKSD